MTYLLWKLAHVIGVVMFLGNITTGLFWAAHAHRKGDLRAVATTFDGIIRSDRWFTTPGVFVILIAGFGAAISGGFPILRTGWIFWSLLLFAVSGTLFSIWVAPLQKRIRSLAETAPATEESWREYGVLYRRWEITGLLAWVTPAIALVLMVLKPPLPGL